MTHIDPRAVVDPSAVLAEGVTVAPFAVIGPNVTIGAGTWVGPHVVFDNHVTVGANNKFSGEVHGDTYLRALTEFGADPEPAVVGQLLASLRQSCRP